MDPSAWMERLQQGDREALEPLLAHYEGMLRYIVSGVLSDPHQQEDCLAEVRLKLWEKREQYDPERSSPATWLTVLCRNAAVDHLRSAQRHSAEALDETRPDPAPGPEEQLLRKERAERLERALASLSSRDRALFYRKYYYLQSTARIAAEPGLTPRAVEGRLYRIRKGLQNKLGGDLL